MRYMVLVGLVLGLAAPALAQGDGGLTGALDRLEQQRRLQQSEMRRETQQQGQELQRQLDQNRLQERLDRQLDRQFLRQPNAPCVTFGTICN
jgi:hypothetical protein